MTDSTLFTSNDDLLARVPQGLPLLVVLGGMTDAGGVISQLNEYLGEHSAPEEIVRFNTDLLYDYRARRPFITFEEDHFSDYESEELVLSLAHDTLGSPFLLLSGYEPDFQWERFIDALLLLIHELEVSVTLWTLAIPMPVPHTRPIGATVSGTREDLIESRSVWKPTSRLPASVTHLLEYRLYELGEDVVGFALLVPHYLANTEYPDVLLAALDSFMSASGLIFSTDSVRDASRDFHRQVNRQVADNEESTEMLRGLEARYDSYMEDQTSRSPLVHEDGTIPTADQLASELERYLAQQRDLGSGDGQSPGL